MNKDMSWGLENLQEGPKADAHADLLCGMWRGPRSGEVPGLEWVVRKGLRETVEKGSTGITCFLKVCYISSLL